MPKYTQPAGYTPNPVDKLSPWALQVLTCLPPEPAPGTRRMDPREEIGLAVVDLAASLCGNTKKASRRRVREALKQIENVYGLWRDRCSERAWGHREVYCIPRRHWIIIRDRLERWWHRRRGGGVVRPAARLRIVRSTPARRVAIYSVRRRARAG